MITRARIIFGPDGDTAVDFNIQEGKRNRSVVRTSTQLAGLPLPAPITVTTFAELFAAVATLADSLKAEDVADEVQREAAEQARLQQEMAKEAAILATKGKAMHP